MIVSSGAERVTVPQVQGLSEQNARSALEGAGLDVKVETQTVQNQNQDGIVITQSPSGNAQVSRGDTVTIFVGKFQGGGGPDHHQPAVTPATLILLRHGESEWNLQNLFTGWYDCGLSPKGEAQAVEAGRLMAERGLAPDVVHTSVLTRAIHTAELALREMDRSWIPVRRHWRLNERHYGDLQGLDKKATAERFGADQVKVWRRAYDVPPPAMPRDDPRNVRRDPRYAALPPELVPDTECLADVVDRMLPYWYDGIVPDLVPGGPCWWPPTATACGRWSSTSAA